MSDWRSVAKTLVAVAPPGPGIEPTGADIAISYLREALDALAAAEKRALGHEDGGKQDAMEQAAQYARMVELHAQMRSRVEAWEEWWARSWDCSATPGHPGAPESQ